ncbi:glucosaminidase domain-containing protein [Paraferrimonas haliotis]|uniref:Glucosaminidase n=1 Tax=Paraferrimonas haliotis TaxID=2013866 RepID=A0AA37TKD2_9GAMM|nr:glucosaminidase domain-containing protein [Paraferrimonas haliotis]GLS82889.1 glucosaminidase [Paraferrimonas haliotis]
MIVNLIKPLKFGLASCLLVAPLSFAGIEVYGDIDKQVPFYSASELAQQLDQHGLKTETVRHMRAVPPVFVGHIPSDLSTLTVEQKTDTFIRIILTNMVQANERIQADRDKLIALHSDHHLQRHESQWVEELAQHYGFGGTPTKEELLKRVDTIPVSLALAQAIDESAWGTSHFAVEGNALFGEHLPPHSKSKKFIQARGADVKLAAFDTVLETCMEYVHNLNTGAAYADLREMRHQARQNNQHISGHELATALVSYSERGNDYVENLQSIINHRNLGELDNTRLIQEQQSVLHIKADEEA